MTDQPGPESDGLQLRPVTLGDRPWQVAGSAEDSFFQWAETHARGMEELRAVAAALLPPDGVAVDVGANFGLSVLALAPLLPQGRVLAVEPSPRTVRALRRTLAMNGLEGRVAVEAVALAAAPGEAGFHDAAHSAGSFLVSAETLQREHYPTQNIRVTTLDALVERHGLTRLDFLKIDVEGHETDVLDGAAACIARFRPTIFAEFNAWTLQCNRSANPRQVLEDWLARFPVVHAVRGTAPPERVTKQGLLPFLHDHLVKRGCADDLVLGFDDAWVARWRPPPG